MHSTLPVTRAVFSAPMWGLTIEPLWRPVVQALAGGSSNFGLGEEFAPGTGPENYLATAGFEDNRLTSSSDTWEYLTRIVKARPGLEIGGPSINWLYQALDETKALQALDPPSHEMLCLIGSDEKVVHKSDVISYVERWKNGHVGIVSGARHEILMETPEIQKRAFDMMDAFFSG
jgi:lysophospholipase